MNTPFHLMSLKQLRKYQKELKNHVETAHRHYMETLEQEMQLERMIHEKSESQKKNHSAKIS